MLSDPPETVRKAIVTMASKVVSLLRLWLNLRSSMMLVFNRMVCRISGITAIVDDYDELREM